MRVIENYIMVYYNTAFHIMPARDKESQLRSMFSAHGIKEICFNTKKKAIAYIYFGKAGEAQRVFEGFRRQTGPYDFKVLIGEDRVSSSRSNNNNNLASSSSTSSSEPVSDQPRSIIIDGDNVAREHGLGRLFSSRGLKLAIEFFENLGHSDVKVVVPENRLKPSTSTIPVQNKKLLQELKNRNMILATKSGIYDDRIIIEQAIKKFAVIVSNDKYQDEQFRSSPTIAEYLNDANIMPFSFDDDDFILQNNTKNSDDYILSRPNPATMMTSSLSPDSDEDIYTVVESANKVYVKFMSNNNNNKTYYDEVKIKKLFGACGTIKSVCVNNGGCLISFMSNDAAFKAVKELNGHQLGEIGGGGGKLRVELYRSRRSEPTVSQPPPPPPAMPTTCESSSDITIPSNKLFIGCINLKLPLAEFRHFFSHHGLIEEIELKETYLFVKYKDVQSAKYVVEHLNGKRGERICYQDRPLLAQYFKRKNN